MNPIEPKMLSKETLADVRRFVPQWSDTAGMGIALALLQHITALEQRIKVVEALNKTLERAAFSDEIPIGIPEQIKFADQLTELQQDKERLDWLSGGLVELRWRRVCDVSTENMNLRQAIDEARKK